MNKDKIIENIAKKSIPILKRNGVSKAGIFGSYARGEMKRNSDIDMLIKLNMRTSLLGMASIKVDLEKTLKKRVDLVEYQMIKEKLKDKILREEVPIL